MESFVLQILVWSFRLKKPRPERQKMVLYAALREIDVGSG